ncbi:MAG: T9SS type A sorting domain-containing protein [Bacteroidetes bacterium]|nr:T9SS type A sorting domain-containing protein [Bacteroidota bacterium]
MRVDPESPASGVSIYPNPGGNENSIISVSHNREEPFRMEIFSADGKLVEQSVFLAAEGIIYLTLPADKLSRGIYTIRITNSDYSFNESNRFNRQ